MITDETVFNSKLYLVKIKVGADYKDEDLIWAIGHQGAHNIDMEDFKNIVMVLNNKGLWTPILSDKRTTWKSIKTSADLKALGHVGQPVLLLEEVLTFKQILEFAYLQKILTDSKGKDILAAKNAELEVAAKTAPSVSVTLEQASTPGTSLSEIVAQTLLNSRNMSPFVSLSGSGKVDDITPINPTVTMPNHTDVVTYTTGIDNTMPGSSSSTILTHESGARILL